VKRYALSLKQPWATLLVHGLKTIEVRRWPTARRGQILIHAARVPDHRPEAWDKLPLKLHDSARMVGGIVGEGELAGCVSYGSAKEFEADQEQHLNDPSWFEPPELFGFKFTDLKPLPFQPFPGWMRFFPVELESKPERPGILQRAVGSDAAHRSRLLVSVRSAGEAASALCGGADIIDIKEPSRGSLGRADNETISAIVDFVAGRKPVSAACGELVQELPIPIAGPLAFVKWGLAGCGSETDWSSRLGMVTAKLPIDCRPVVVAYADWQRAQAPSPEAVTRSVFAIRRGALLVDTWQKDGKSLLDFLSLSEIDMIIRRCQVAGIPVALAGSLDGTTMEALLPLRPEIIAVRAAACRNGNRNDEIDSRRVRRLVALLRAWRPPTSRKRQRRANPTRQ
jgi:uncharacterized protein (UPF0264 family)